MALEALSRGLPVKIVPVGLTYFHPHKFRSRAVVEFGDAIDVSPEFVKEYANGKRRESIGKLLEAIYSALSAVTLTAPDFETMTVCNSLITDLLPR